MGRVTLSCPHRQMSVQPLTQATLQRADPSSVTWKKNQSLFNMAPSKITLRWAQSEYPSEAGLLPRAVQVECYVLVIEERDNSGPKDGGGLRNLMKGMVQQWIFILISSHIVTNFRTQLTHWPRKPDQNKDRSKKDIGLWGAGNS